MRDDEVENSMYLLFAVFRDVIIEKAGRRSPTKRVGNKQLLARFVYELEIKSLELKVHPLKPR
jgi:hypothetical protein